MKDSYYFPHDANASHDPKCSALINDFGFTGYGLYWAIIEILHEQRNGKLEKFPKLYEGLAFQLNITKEEITKQMEAMLKDYCLLQEDEKYIWSNRVLRNLENRKAKYQAKAEAGRIGGIHSGIARQTKQNEAVLKANEQKESKVKESKVKDIKEDTMSGREPDDSAFQTFVKEVVSYLNEKVGKHYSLDSNDVKEYLKPRFKEKRTIEECKLVILYKTIEWNKTPPPGQQDMRKYLTIETLFRKGNFPRYLIEAKQKQAEVNK